jgi:hypothetical protein
MPVSVTVKCRQISSLICHSTATCVTTSLAWVNLMALPTRFTTTCRKNPELPTNVSGTSGAIRQAISQLDFIHWRSLTRAKWTWSKERRLYSCERSHRLAICGPFLSWRKKGNREDKNKDRRLLVKGNNEDNNWENSLGVGVMESKSPLRRFQHGMYWWKALCKNGLTQEGWI